jgi:hypothetical protein
MMTKEQKDQIDKHKLDFAESCKKYKGYDGCTFGLFYNPTNEEDKNITIISTYINGFSDNLQPYYETIYLLIEPNGNVVSLMDVFPMGDVSDYVKKLQLIYKWDTI